jgi:hypothetical protein
VLGAEPIDDLGAGRHHVPERRAADPLLELFDDLAWKASGNVENGRSRTIPIISQ